MSSARSGGKSVLESLSPRELEDLSVPCASCGELPTGVVFGPRDWPVSPDALIADEIETRLAKIRGTPTTPEPGGDGLDEASTGNAEPEWTVDSRRVDATGRQPTCAACGTACAFSMRDVVGAHNRLEARDLKWLHGYVTMKHTIVSGLRHANVGIRGDLGMFVAAVTPQRVMPVFVPSQRLTNLVDKRLLGTTRILSNLASPKACKAAGRDIGLPTGYPGTDLVLDAELGIGLAEIGKALRVHGRTPLRGIGTLRIAEVEWGDEHGRLLYMEFEPRLRAEVARLKSE